MDLGKDYFYEASQLQHYEWIFIGGVLSATPDFINRNEISYVLTCGADLNISTIPKGVQHKTIKIYDTPVQPLFTYLKKCFQFIEKCRRSKQRILIHCRVGKSRSVSILMMYLMYTYHLSTVDSIKTIRLTRPIAQPNRGFLQQIRLFEKNDCDIKSAMKEYNALKTDDHHQPWLRYILSILLHIPG